MVELVIHRTEQLKGSVEAPPSKSYTHRAVIASSLADGVSKIVNPLVSDDTMATVKACKEFGAQIELNKNKWIIRGLSKIKTPSEIINCKDSASTLRFIIPIAALAPGITILTGEESLKKRPIGPLLDALTRLGAKCFSAAGYPPILVYGGGIDGGETQMVGNISSQFISGLLFACPLARRKTKLKLTTKLESKPYVKMTVETLKKHGILVKVSKDMQSYIIPANQHYKSADHTVSGDYSAASFILAAAAITGSTVTVKGLHTNSNQGDEAIIGILRSMGAKFEVGRDYVKVSSGQLKGINIDASDIPDLVPVCAAIACYANGTTRIFNAGRLKLKESDRLANIPMELKKMGAKISEQKDSLIISGPSKLHGAKIDPHNDHRIAMACAVAALKAEGVTKVKRIEAVNKSYPDFISDMRKLGAAYNVR